MKESEENTTHSAGITGLVLTCNGERLIEKCLTSLAFCDEILVVDSGSKDATLTLAAQHGARIVHNDWQGFAHQFTFAHTLITTRWFFIVDQDEVCPAPLATAITHAIAQQNIGTTQPPTVAFSVGRKSWYFDRFLQHSGWYPDHILRVFRTGFVEFYQDAHIHYRPLGHTAHIGSQGAELVHYPYTGFDHQLSKINVYAQQGADHMLAKGKRATLAKAIGHALWRFIRIYFLKRGFLDGKAGFITAVHAAFYVFSKYVRTMEATWGAPFTRP